MARTATINADHALDAGSSRCAALRERPEFNPKAFRFMLAPSDALACGGSNLSLPDRQPPLDVAILERQKKRHILSSDDAKVLQSSGMSGWRCSNAARSGRTLDGDGKFRDITAPKGAMSSTSSATQPMRQTADLEQKLADCVGAVYEAAGTGTDWHQAGRLICDLFDARSIALNTVMGNGRFGNLLQPPTEFDRNYYPYFHRLNPYAARAQEDYKRDRSFHVGRAQLDEAIVPDKELLASEYYRDFARFHERRYMIGGMLGVETAMPIALFRAEGQRRFDEQERRLLQMLLPHFQRALELESRLAAGRRTTMTAWAALDALPAGIAIIDAEMRLHFLNQSARAFVDKAHAPLATRCSGPHGRGAYLTALSRSEMARMRKLAEAAAGGGAGGSMRVLGDGTTPCALLVSPLPRSLSAKAGLSGSGEGLVLLLLRRVEQQISQSAAMLCDLFDLSMAEAEVAIALAGGASAEHVARQRGVSLATVRSQVRAILEKSESDNLRAFERVMAGLAAIKPMSPSQEGES